MLIRINTCNLLQP